MYQIIGNRGSGKTYQLMEMAKKNNGVLVCSNPQAMKEKSIAYGLTGFDVISYKEFLLSDEFDGRDYFIDEMETFLRRFVGDKNVKGYSLTIGD